MPRTYEDTVAQATVLIPPEFFSDADFAELTDVQLIAFAYETTPDQVAADIRRAYGNLMDSF